MLSATYASSSLTSFLSEGSAGHTATSASGRPLLRTASRQDPRVPFHAPAEITGWAERLAWCFAQPDRPQSFRPLLYPCMPGLGKLGLSYGATLVGNTAEKGGHAWVPGAAVMAGSTAVVLLGVVLLGNTVGHVSRRGAPWIKFVAIFGGVLMGLGYGLGGLAMARRDLLWAYGVGTASKWTGTALMGGTLPTFIVHATAVLGNQPFHRHRGTVAAGLMATGVASLAVGGSLANMSHVPLAGSTAVTVVSAFACALATGIYASELPTWPYARPAPSADLPPATHLQLRPMLLTPTPLLGRDEPGRGVQGV